MDWHDAHALAGSVASALGAEPVPLSRAVARVLARPVVARQDVPHFASSAMDGWAIAGPEPWTVVDRARLNRGEASAIVTGGAVPPGTSAVLRSEHAVHSRDGVLRTAPGTPVGEPWDGQHIRVPGQEARAGELVVPRSRVLNPAHIALAALCGYDELEVVREPVVSFVLTGDEVEVAGLPATGRVRDTFGPQLPAFVSLLGARAGAATRVGDDLADTVRSLRESARTSDVVITTGGTGFSAADHLRPALDEWGAETVIDRIRMRPGGPTVLARDPAGCFCICLPGNPLAAMMGMLTVAVPLIAALSGRPCARPGRVPVGEDVAGRPGSTLLVPFVLEDDRARGTAWRGSAMMRGLADADGVMVVPEGGLARGGEAETIALPWSHLAG
jgi:molybdopterin molybdotransferase